MSNTNLRVPFVDLVAQSAALESELNTAVGRILQGADYILGKDVTAFEEEFAAFCEVQYAVGVDSGTSALELVLRAYEIGPGDEVITVANTFIATTFAISYTGARPVLVDVNPRTCTLDTTQLERAITPRTRAIIPVHLFGHPADMDPILRIARRQELIVIEDACQAHGAKYKNRRAGGLADAAAFSFYPAKNLGAAGDAGAIVTNDELIAKRVRMLRDYGQSAKYHHEMLGYNHRMDSLQAAILRTKLPHLEEWNRARREHAQQYSDLLAEAGVVLPIPAAYAEPVYHLYVIRTAERDEMQMYLKSRGISTGIHYPIPLHLQEAYRHLGYNPGSFPVTEHMAPHILSLPMYPELTEEQIRHVADAILEFVTDHNVELARA